ncbi:unnamed protein product, partial [Prorocentrum cordatum]
MAAVERWAAPAAEGRSALPLPSGGGAAAPACPAPGPAPPPAAKRRRTSGGPHLRVAVVCGPSTEGLPLAVVLAERGHSVVVVDSDAARLESLRDGRLPFLEAGGPELLARCLRSCPERLQLTGDIQAVSECDVIVVTTGTPVDEHLNPHFRAVESCVGGLCRHLRGGQTLVLRAALFPG